MRYLLIVCLCWVTHSAEAGRRVVSSPIDLYNGYAGEVGAVALRIKIDLVNLSNVVQTVNAKVSSVMLSHAIWLPDLTTSAIYSNWVTSTLQPKLRQRWLGTPQIVAPQLTLGPNQRHRIKLSLACKLDNTGSANPFVAPTCTDNEVDILGYVPPSPVTRAEAGASMHFEVDIDQEKGAVLGAFSVDYKLGTNYESITREFNGGRPF